MTDEPQGLAPNAERDESLGLGLLDAQGQIVAANQGYLDWVGQPGSADLVAARLRPLLDGASTSNLQLASYSAIRLDRLQGPGGELVLVTVAPQREATMPTVDPLTGLPDRRAIAERVAAWRRAASSASARFAVLFLDLDDFKIVNDRHGHAIGDAMLRGLALRWAGCVRDCDLVARYGGDEFVVLLQHAATEDDVAPVIRRLQEATQQPIAVGDLSLVVSATIGWTAATDADERVDALIAAADRDMYARKGRVLR